jgi:hypothetical protein
MTTTLLRVPGTETLSREDVGAFLAMCDRHGWNPDHIATVISLESGWNPSAGSTVWAPKRTASGLLQFIEATARALGVAPSIVAPPGVVVTDDARARAPWATWRVLSMSVAEQIPLVEAYYSKAFAYVSSPRRVDYYLAAYGSAHIGKPLGAVLARKGEKIYEGNRGLDLDKDGAIEVSDLDAFMVAKQSQATGRIDVSAGVADGAKTGESRGARALGLLAVVALAALAAVSGAHGKQATRTRD